MVCSSTIRPALEMKPVMERLMCDSKQDVCNTKSPLKMTAATDDHNEDPFEQICCTKKKTHGKGKSTAMMSMMDFFCFGFPVALGALTSVRRPTGLICSRRCLDWLRTHTPNTNTHMHKHMKTLCHVVKRHTHSLSSSLSSYSHRFSGSSVFLSPLPPLPAVWDSSGI